MSDCQSFTSSAVEERNRVPFECVGHPALIRQSIDVLDWGGTCVILGVPKFGTEADFMVASMYNDKTIMGCRYGAGRPHKDIPLFVDHYMNVFAAEMHRPVPVLEEESAPTGLRVPLAVPDEVDDVGASAP